MFAQRVLLVEGASERALIGYLADVGKLKHPPGGVAVIDTLGKWNMHRFMNLLAVLRIPHGVLFDRDDRAGKAEKHKKQAAVLNEFIQASRNDFTYGMEHFDEDLEHALGLSATVRQDQKPQYLLHAVVQAEVPAEKLDQLVKTVQGLLTGAAQGSK